jgi:restriction system protein
MASRAEKLAALSALAERRRAADPGGAYRQVGYFHDGLHDRHGWVSPWTISACNVESDVMIVGQDWASDDFLREAADPEQGANGEKKRLETNKNLKWLLKEGFGKELADVYRTNAFVFVKPRGMSAAIPAKDLRRSIATYTLREIEIVRPKMVICLGARTFNGFRRLHSLPEARLRDVDYRRAELTVHDAGIYGVPHCGGRGLASTGGRSKSLEIWRTLAGRLAA